MASSYSAGNICVNCSRKSSNGLIRESMFFCCSDCYDEQIGIKVYKHKHVVYSDTKRPSSYSGHSGHRMQLIPQYTPINKKCNYCFDQYDVNIRPGTPHGSLWFCCQDHLNLANPRPKHVIMGHPGPIIMGHPGQIIMGRPFMGHPGPVIMGHPGPIIMGHPGPVIMGGPFTGPFFGPPF